MIKGKTDLKLSCIKSIIELLTYDVNIKNNDIVYQPFVVIEENLLGLAPHLILASRPERNLISIIHKTNDTAYFNLTNLREGIMQEELTSKLNASSEIEIDMNIPLPGKLPDIDYAIYNKDTNTIIICELKWLIEADSTSEVYSRINDIDHGCNQVSDIVEYASNKTEEFKSVFNSFDFIESPKVIGCVVSKNGIRVKNAVIPVINLQTFINLLNKESFIKVIDIINNKEYLTGSIEELEYGSQPVRYGGYTFEIPALIKNTEDVLETYIRKSRKIGRNESCPCGSGKKYKHCCGK